MSQAVLSRESGELLLAILEQRDLTIAGSVLDEFGEGVAHELRRHGLQPAGVAPMQLVHRDNGIDVIDLDWSPESKGYGYFDFVLPDASSLVTYRADLDWWLKWLTGVLALGERTRPTEIVPGLAWDLGDLWVTSKRKVPVIFARRLHFDPVVQELRTALERRAGRSGGIILTSTRGPRLLETSHILFNVVSISDVLGNDALAFSIDRALLLFPFTGVTSPAASLRPLDLSPDGRRLIINGVDEVTFRSAKQIRLIRRLVANHQNNERWPANQLLAEAGIEQNTLQRAFGAKKWAILRSWLTSRDRLWGFDL